MEILKWLNQNKEWAFSGVGVVIIGWILRRVFSRPEPGSSSTDTVTLPPNINQSPTVTQSPIINVNLPQSPAVPPKQEPPATPRPPSSRPNLRVETTKVGKIYFHESVFRLQGPSNRGQCYRALLVDIANVPTSGKIAPVTVRAALIIQGRSYSPLPWIGEYLNAVTLEPAARKSLLLAAGEDRQLSAWTFVLNHRESYLRHSDRLDELRSNSVRLAYADFIGRCQ